MLRQSVWPRRERANTYAGDPSVAELPASLGSGHAGDRTGLLLVASLALIAVAWAAVILVAEEARFAVYAPEAQAAEGAASAFTTIFGALVLFLFPADQARQRMRWVAAGLVILAAGDLMFGYIELLLGDISDLNTSKYEGIVVRTIAGTLFCVGLAPVSSPAF